MLGESRRLQGALIGPDGLAELGAAQPVGLLSLNHIWGAGKIIPAPQM
jgi:hypothetical protein